MSQHDTLTQALHDAASSLETISSLAGKSYDQKGQQTGLDTFQNVRMYAASRASVARTALSVTQPAQAAQSEDVTPERAELCAAWNELPDAIRCHPGVKRLYRALQGAHCDKPQAAQGAGEVVHLAAVDHAHELLRRMGYHRDGDWIIHVNRRGAESIHVSTISSIVNAALIVASQDMAKAQPEPNVQQMRDMLATQKLAIVPMRPTSAMIQIFSEDDWQWEDVLAYAGAITEEEYEWIANHEPATPAQPAPVVPDGGRDAIESALAALDSAQNGLRWYQGEAPQFASEADEETHQQIDEAGDKLNALLAATPTPPAHKSFAELYEANKDGIAEQAAILDAELTAQAAADARDAFWVLEDFGGDGNSLNRYSWLSGRRTTYDINVADRYKTREEAQRVIDKFHGWNAKPVEHAFVAALATHQQGGK